MTMNISGIWCASISSLVFGKIGREWFYQEKRWNVRKLPYTHTYKHCIVYILYYYGVRNALIHLLIQIHRKHLALPKFFQEKKLNSRKSAWKILIISTTKLFIFKFIQPSNIVWRGNRCSIWKMQHSKKFVFENYK